MAIIGIKLDPTGCGWAVADKNFDVLNIRGKDLIGARVYGKADIAQERRIKRSERRRKAAIKRRIAFLDDIFRDSLETEYPGFMQSVKKAGLKEDTPKQFSFSDKYPTIHHAKKAVKEGSEADLRIIYLVLLYAMKHRGHFNYKGSVADVQNITYSYAAYRKELSAYGITTFQGRESPRF